MAVCRADAMAVHSMGSEGSLRSRPQIIDCDRASSEQGGLTDR